MDDHSTWSQTTLTPEEIRQMVASSVKEVMEKFPGNVPGHLVDAVEALSTPIVRWEEVLKLLLGKYVGGRRNTFSRTNRRIQQFGVKGVSHHAAGDVVVVVDTSGSIGQDELQQFFAEIERMCSRSRVHLLQWDYGFQDYRRYRRGDWRKISVKSPSRDAVAPTWLLPSIGWMPTSSSRSLSSA